MNDRILAILLVLVVGAAAGAAEEESQWAKHAPPGARITEDGWFAPVEPGIKPPTLPKEITKAFIIPIHGPITGATYDIVKNKATRCRGKGAEMIIFDMDTPGGAGDAMQNIIDLISQDLKGIYTLAYVNPNAYSAGALISLACHSIAMAPRAVIGDSMPILITPNGGLQPIPKDERAKMESPIRVLVRGLAEDRGYIPVVCEAMVTASMELWLIRHETTGQLQIVDADHWEKIQKVNPTPKWKYVETFDPDNLLVTLETKKALLSGIAQHKFENQQALEKHFHVTTPATLLEDKPLDRLAYWLTSPAVAGFLVMGVLFGAYMEFKTPGLGIFGAVAVLCLLTLIGSRYLVGLANPVEVGIVALGVLLLVMEIFLIPGFGVAGVSGIVLILGGLLAMWLPNAPTEFPIPKVNGDWTLLTNGIVSLLGGFIGATILAAWLARYLPQSKLMTKSKLVLAPAGAAHDAPRPDDSPMLRVRPGDLGTAESILRPVGEVRFGKDLLDAVSRRGIIEVGQRVRVLRRDGNRIVVELAGDENA
jgi:membrane-bound serine protease (ClpP class)